MYNFAILDISAPELLIIFGILVLLFGAKKLPELTRSITASAKEIKSGLSDDVSTPVSHDSQNS